MEGRAQRRRSQPRNLRHVSVPDSAIERDVASDRGLLLKLPVPQFLAELLQGWGMQ